MTEHDVTCPSHWQLTPVCVRCGQQRFIRTVDMMRTETEQDPAVVIKMIIEKHSSSKIRKKFSIFYRQICRRYRARYHAIHIQLVCKDQLAVINSSLS